jgi:hypothetical protein
MITKLIGFTAAVAFTVGSAVAQQAGGGLTPQLGTSNSERAECHTGERGNTASLAERRRSAQWDDPAADCWRWPGEQSNVY